MADHICCCSIPISPTFTTLISWVLWRRTTSMCSLSSHLHTSHWLQPLDREFLAIIEFFSVFRSFKQGRQSPWTVYASPLPSPFPSLPFLFPYPFLTLPLPLPFPSLPLEAGPLNPARCLGERCKLPQRGLGRSPSRNRIWCNLALKYGIWWQQF